MAAPELALPQGVTLRVYNKGELLFQSAKKWLHPLFDLEAFLIQHTCSISRQDLLLVDKIVGKAAALFIIRLGISRVNTTFISHKGEATLVKAGVTLQWKQRIESVKCLSERFLADEEDVERAYLWLSERRRLSLLRISGGGPSESSTC